MIGQFKWEQGIKVHVHVRYLQEVFNEHVSPTDIQ